MDHASRRERLTSGLQEADAFLVTHFPNVRYLTGFTGSNGQALLNSGGGILFTDGRYETQSRREVPDLRRVIYLSDFPGTFAGACREMDAGRVAFEPAGMTWASHRDLAATGIELVPAAGAVERLRWQKDSEELKLIEEAQALTDQAFARMTRFLAEGMTERQAAFELETFFRQQAEGPAFDSIVAFGESAAEPHHHPTDRALARGDVVKVDMGCCVEGYRSDMTRTVAFGEPDPRLREVYEIVRRAQEAGVESVREGVTGGEVDAVVRGIIAEAGYGEAFKHGLGHGIGLEVHEGPSLRRDGKDVLPVGTVVTVEPGIYLDGLGGVRLEDMVLVEEAGCRVLPSTDKELMVL